MKIPARGRPGRPDGPGRRPGDSGRRERTPAPLRETAEAGRRGETHAADGFLEVLRVAVGAARVAVWRRAGEAWGVEREATDGRAEPWPDRSLEAAGHPFTWAHREGLQLQVLSEELFGGATGWSLVGGPAGSGRVLCISFEGAPGPTARPVLAPALRHLRTLYRGEPAGRGGAREPGGPAV